MKFNSIFTNAFDKDLKAISKKHPKDIKTILESIDTILLNEPFSADTKQLECFKYYRYRIGKYRIVFDLRETNTIVFLAIDHRGSIYEKLRKRFNRC
jgi:mRNA interferase RelE/StbE